MDRIFRGIIRYRRTNRAKMVEQFVRVKDRPEPEALFFTCMDSRMLPARFTDSHVGDMFVVRNAGNLIPRSTDGHTASEPAALELGCVHNGIRHVIVCGHSDCKAMNLLRLLGDADRGSAVDRRTSPLRAWLRAHATSSLEKYRWLEAAGSDDEPLVFQAETPSRRITAYIDPGREFSATDKLSQVNTLQQVQNIASYGFLQSRLEARDLHVHALWFDIYTGDVHYFSRQRKRFVDVNEKIVDGLVAEVSEYLLPGHECRSS